MAGTSPVLPLAEAWYRRLLVVALLLGVGGGLAAVVYIWFTGFGTDLLFGDPTSDPFSGNWWWIPLLSMGAMGVAFLRQWTGVADKVPGAVAYARQGWVDPSSALPLFAISAISLFVGASLGPSFGIIISGGGLGSWLSQRAAVSDMEGQHEYALTGMSAGLSGVFAAPLFASIMVSELAPSPRSRYVALFVPAFAGSVIAYVIFIAMGGKGLLDAFQVTGYEYDNIHLLYGLLLGVLSIVVLVAQAVVGNGVRWVSAKLTSPILRAGVLGALVGSIAFALPLTVTGGSTQLAFETSRISELSVGLLIAVLIGKMFAFVLSQEAGFLGGPVFPILFIGGTAGIIVHLLMPDIPAPLAVAAMLAAVPAATIAAPVSFIVLGGGVVATGISGLPPIGIAVIVAHLAVWGLDLFQQTRDSM
jgi:H+/Cl- antiporter ClcA